MTFYLKYRSKTIDELDLARVREKLLNIIKSGQIPHAFLFSGPKGSGKTSAARILAKVFNCENFDAKKGEPCNKCPTCLSIIKGENLDVIEIDAASHRGIDDIRALRDAVKLSPACAKKKVYIIDEAHMLTTEASNALLKTLEEPPDHVVFILATTNPEKIIETVRSRTVNIPFSKATNDEIVRSLTRVVEGEKLKVKGNVLKTIASSSDGSFRDAVKILEELVMEKVKLEEEDVEEYLLNKKAFDTDKFILILNNGNEKDAYLEIEKASEKGASFKNITVSILERLRSFLFAKIGISDEDKSSFSKEEILELIRLFSRSYSEANYSVLEQIPLELAVSDWFAGKIGDKDDESKPDKNYEKKDDSEINNVSELKNNSIKENKNLSKKQTDVKTGLVNGFDETVWSRILTEVKPINASTEALLRASKPVGYDGKTLTLGVYYKFHKEKLETNFHRSLLESVVRGVMGENVRIVCTLTDPPIRQNGNHDSDQVKGNETVVLVESDGILNEGEDEEIVKAAKEIFGS